MKLVTSLLDINLYVCIFFYSIGNEPQVLLPCLYDYLINETICLAFHGFTAGPIVWLRGVIFFYGSNILKIKNYK